MVPTINVNYSLVRKSITQHHIKHYKNASNVFNHLQWSNANYLNVSFHIHNLLDYE